MIDARETILNRIRQAPSFPKLRKAVIAFHKSLHPYGFFFGDFEKLLKDIEDRPDRLLTAHARVLNAKSARAKTLLRLADAVFSETGLPRKPQGKFRFENGLDWEKLGLE